MTRHVAHYTLVRLLPQSDAGEFVNIGIVLVCPALRRFDFQLLASAQRVTHFFQEFTAALFRQVGADLEDELVFLKTRITEGMLEPSAVLTELCRPLANDPQRQQACREVEADLQALTGVEVVSVDDAAPSIAFARRHAALN